MKDKELFGIWTLVCSNHVSNLEFQIDEDDEDWEVSDEAIKSWLSHTETGDITSFQRDKGLKLTISKDMSFSEVRVGDSEIMILDEEGVQLVSSEFDVFNGFVRNYQGKYFIEPREFPGYAEMDDQFSYDVHTRVFDDSLVTDHVFIQDGHLVRVVNQITDLLYLDRFIYVYEKP